MFKQEIKTLVRDVLAAIIKTIESEDFEQQRKQILNSFIETTNQMYLELEQESKEKGFTERAQPGRDMPGPFEHLGDRIRLGAGNEDPKSQGDDHGVGHPEPVDAGASRQVEAGAAVVFAPPAFLEDLRVA